MRRDRGQLGLFSTISVLGAVCDSHGCLWQAALATGAPCPRSKAMAFPALAVVGCLRWWPQVALLCGHGLLLCASPEMDSPWPFIIATGNLITALSEKERLIYNTDFVMKV